MFSFNTKLKSDQIFSPNFRLLTNEEMLLVTGGDDGGSCSPSGDCGSASASDGAVGTLGEVTVNGSEVGLSDGEAENLVNNIDAAMASPGIAAIYFGLTAFNLLSSLPSTPPLGNPMGDPNPMGAVNPNAP